MMTKDEMLEMLDDPRGDCTGWRDFEIEEFMEVMGSDGWVTIKREERDRKI